MLYKFLSFRNKIVHCRKRSSTRLSPSYQNQCRPFCIFQVVITRKPLNKVQQSLLTRLVMLKVLINVCTEEKDPVLHKNIRSFKYNHLMIKNSKYSDISVYFTGGKDPGLEKDVTIFKRSSDRETPIFLRHLQGAPYTDTGEDDVVDDNSTDEIPENEEEGRNCTPASK